MKARIQFEFEHRDARGLPFYNRSPFTLQLISIYDPPLMTSS